MGISERTRSFQLRFKSLRFTFSLSKIFIALSLLLAMNTFFDAVSTIITFEKDVKDHNAARVRTAARQELSPPSVEEFDNDSRSTCELAKTDFHKASGLLAIVTGMEHSGTTIMHNLISSSPKAFGGFECGVLLAEKPEDFVRVHPFYEWMGDPATFGLTEKQRDDHLLGVNCHAKMYQNIKRHSSLFQHPVTQNSWIIDKTPRYLLQLTKVMDKTPGVPVIITVKAKSKQIKSFINHWEYREKRPADDDAYTFANRLWDRENQGFRKAMLKYGQNATTSRIMVVNMTEFYVSPSIVMTGVYRFLGLGDWNPEFLTMETLNTKRTNAGLAPNMTAFDPMALWRTGITPKTS